MDEKFCGLDVEMISSSDDSFNVTLRVCFQKPWLWETNCCWQNYPRQVMRLIDNQIQNLS